VRKYTLTVVCREAGEIHICPALSNSISSVSLSVSLSLSLSLSFQSLTGRD
jgi:putative Mg2+ transporter-C (MgtC) family protein